MTFIKKFLKWSATGAVIGGAYGLGLKKGSEKVPVRRFWKGRK